MIWATSALSKNLLLLINKQSVTRQGSRYKRDMGDNRGGYI